MLKGEAITKKNCTYLVIKQKVKHVFYLKRIASKIASPLETRTLLLARKLSDVEVV